MEGVTVNCVNSKNQGNPEAGLFCDPLHLLGHVACEVEQ